MELSRRRKDPKNVRHKRTARKPRPRDEWIHLPGVTASIASQELFMAAQHQLRVNALNSPRNRKHRYLLSGRIRCGCGWSMRSRTVSPRYVYYDCRRKGREYGPDRCRAKVVNAREVEALVWSEVKKALSGPKAIRAALQARQQTLDPGGLRGDLEASKREIDGLRKQEANPIYLYRVGEYDEELLGMLTSLNSLNHVTSSTRSCRRAINQLASLAPGDRVRLAHPKAKRILRL